MVEHAPAEGIVAEGATSPAQHVPVHQLAIEGRADEVSGEVEDGGSAWLVPNSPNGGLGEEEEVLGDNVGEAALGSSGSVQATMGRVGREERRSRCRKLNFPCREWGGGVEGKAGRAELQLRIARG